MDNVALCSYILTMKTVNIRDAKNRLTELARDVERGETVVVTRNGRPIFDLVPHKTRGGVNFAAGEAFLAERGITQVFRDIPDSFDEPLDEAVLISPLPPD